MTSVSFCQYSELIRSRAEGLASLNPDIEEEKWDLDMVEAKTLLGAKPNRAFCV